MPPGHWPRPGTRWYAQTMLTRLFILVSILMAAGTVLAQAYRWVDDDGIVHYSDRPQEGAERVFLPSDNRVTRRVAPTPVAAAATSSSEQQPEPAAFQYESLAVSSPAAEETLWNIAGVLSVSLDLQPGLQRGHLIRLYFDGNARDPVASTSFQVEEVWRGVHNLQAEVGDETGQLMIRSATNRFYVQQTNIN